MLFLEELEARNCPSSVCDANPTYTAECQYVDSLVPQSAITITAVQSGNWSDASTWGGRLPTTGDNVWIPQGVSVTVDKQEPGALRSILDNGVLSFAPNVSTSLDVNTLVVGTDTNTPGVPQGELDIGTSANPIQANVQAQLIFADSQSVSPGLTQAQLFTNDTEEMTGGLIDMGTLNFYGSEVTPYANLSSAAVAGSTGLSLDAGVSGWKVGDTLLIAGDQPEEATIASISGSTITLTSPLQYTHSAPAGQDVQVADENRSVIIRDEGTSTQYADGSDGMVMQMHSDSAAMYYTQFAIPGRTDKSVPLGSALSNGTINHVARYSVHFHRDYYPGFTDSDPPIQVVGCFQSGGVGWGYDNHSSNVDFVNDVAFNDFGAGFVDEAGNELGSFAGCLAVDVPGVPNSDMQLAHRQNVQDFGWNGEGFWLMSPSTTETNDHVWDAQIGYAFWGEGLVQGPLGLTTSWATHAQGMSMPIAGFSGDTAGGVDQGLSITWRNVPGVFSNFSAWDVKSYGVALGLYTNLVDLESPTLSGLPGSQIGIKAQGGGYTTNLTIDNADVVGFSIGTWLVSTSTENISGGYWDDKEGFYIPPAIQPRSIVFGGNVVFGPDTVTGYYVNDWNAAQLLDQQSKQKEGQCNFSNDPFFYNQILLPGGMQLYATDQAPDYVPFPTGTTYNDPPAFLGLTNAQLWADFGICLDNIVANGATTSPLTNGLIGPAQTMPDYYWLSGTAASIAPASQPYTLKYKDYLTGVVTTWPDPITLNTGWNVITELVNGMKHSWLVYGT